MAAAKRDDLKTVILRHFAGNWYYFYDHFLGPAHKKSGKQPFWNCPFHGDRDPSFTVKDPDKGAYYCHAEKKGGDPFHFFAKLKGLDTRSQFREVLEEIAEEFNLHYDKREERRQQRAEREKDKSERKIVATYDYVDAGGELLFQVVRFKPKAFSQRRPKRTMIGDKCQVDWVWNLQGITPVLYHLPEVLQAQEVFLVEGEKDADNLRAIGFTATTNPMGAQKWMDHYSDSLEGKDVVMLFDNDSAGLEHLQKVAKLVRKRAASLRVIELPNLGPGEDVSDWLESYYQGQPTEAFIALNDLVDETEPWRPPSRLEYYELVALTKTELERPAAIVGAGLLPRESMLIIGGAHKRGKSILAFNLACCLAKGIPFLNHFEIEEPHNVLYVQEEISIYSMQDRATKVVDGFNGIPENRVYIMSKQGVKLDNADLLDMLIDEIENIGVPFNVIMLDPLYKLHSGNENNVQEMTQFFYGVEKLIKQFHCSVCLTHHATKVGIEQVREGSDLLRGSGTIADVGDSYMMMLPAKGFPRNYSKVYFTLRNEEDPRPLFVERESDTLTYNVLAEDRPSLEGKTALTPEAIAQVCQELGRPTNPELRKELSVRYNVSENWAAKKIIHAEKHGFIGSEQTRGAGGPKVYYAKKVTL